MDTPGVWQPSQSHAFWRSAYFQYSLLLLIISVLSLIPQYFSHLIRSPGTLSPQLIAHGAFFLAWYFLFCIQSGLVNSGQKRLHRQLGYLSLVFTAYLLYSGTAMMVATMNSFQADWSAQYLYSRTSFVWAIFHTLVSFAGFYLLAIYYRKNAGAHKRFMLLASLSMMSASITRFAYLPIIPIDGTAFTLLLTYTLLVTPLIIDKFQHQKVHPVLGWGVAIYIISQLLAMGLMPNTSIGQSLAFFR